MPTALGSWSAVVADAMKGDLTESDFIGSIQAIGPSVSQVQFVLSILHRTEGNQAWVKNGVVQVVNGQIAINPNALKPDAPGVAPGINAPNPLGTNPLTGINAIGDFFSRLEQPATWKRVGEFLAGGILLWIGVNALTRDTAVRAPARQVKAAAQKTASTAVKVGKKVAK